VQGRLQCGQAPAEWRLAGWLEEQGIDYDYYSEAQLHDGTLPLDQYRVLITAVHPEYWSRDMYTRVKSWVADSGGRLMYLGGNGLNCEVRFNAGDTLTCLSHDDSKHPSNGQESRMHRTFEPEAALLGVVFTDPGAMTGAPYEVLEHDHWIFEGSGLRNGDVFGEKTLHERVPGGASGHETDKISASSPAGIRALARGLNSDGGGAEIVCFGLGAGAVFSAGSITWVSALFTDSAVSRITRNVAERFLAAQEVPASPGAATAGS
ncbi:MAG: carboxypeptidase regulatory-like domain-containing protein, partial [Pyrinomonadaceae bacterium]|nr:carboxypeptidase regulatory-like domain-containing protein [Pyrinomonadaceae bacterium]